MGFDRFYFSRSSLDTPKVGPDLIIVNIYRNLRFLFVILTHTRKISCRDKRCKSKYQKFTKILTIIKLEHPIALSRLDRKQMCFDDESEFDPKG